MKGFMPITVGSSIFDPNDPSWEPLRVVGWVGPGCPGVRTVDELRKRRDRRARKLARAQRRHMRHRG